jgi:hypothetical protein
MSGKGDDVYVDLLCATSGAIAVGGHLAALVVSTCGNSQRCPAWEPRGDVRTKEVMKARWNGETSNKRVFLEKGSRVRNETGMKPFKT